jgi:hypothetical protein
MNSGTTALLRLSIDLVTMILPGNKKDKLSAMKSVNSMIG